MMVIREKETFHFISIVLKIIGNNRFILSVSYDGNNAEKTVVFVVVVFHQWYNENHGTFSKINVIAEIIVGKRFILSKIYLQ